MASLDSTSTDAEVTAAYMDNCGHREDDSATKAAAFVTACTAMMVRGISRFQHGEEAMHFSLEDLRALTKEAQAFVREKAGVSGGGAGALHADLRNFRN